MQQETFSSQQNQSSLSPQEAEAKHQNEILMTFKSYQELMLRTVPGSILIEKSKKIDSVKYYQMLQQRKRQTFEQAVLCNQKFLSEIIDFCEGSKRISQLPNVPVSFNNFSKIKSTVKQFFREWSDEGPEVLDYTRIVTIAQKYLNKSDKILAPGSGLGRLVLEFVAAGFGCQGNQVSYFMLYGSNFILNCVEEEKQYEIYPFISSADYYYNQMDIFRSVKIPDKVACKIVGQDADFSMAAGEFTEVYEKMPEEFHGVATCFFIDTANNIFDYVNTIHKVLKPNGIWINYGPLLFHYRQVFNEVSIEISWEILKAYIQDKFQFLQQQLKQASYCHDPQSQMGVHYNCITFVCRKK